MKAQTSSDRPVMIPVPAPVQAHECGACGRDPCIVWDANGHFRIGRDETQAKERDTHLCLSCATESARWIYHRIPTLLAMKEELK